MRAQLTNKLRQTYQELCHSREGTYRAGTATQGVKGGGGAGWDFFGFGIGVPGFYETS